VGKKDIVFMLEGPALLETMFFEKKKSDMKFFGLH